MDHDQIIKEYEEHIRQYMLSHNVPQTQQTEHIIRKLWQVWRDGYRPARGNESYEYRLKNKTLASTMVNCMGHIFNLRNQQLDDYDFGPFQIFNDFPSINQDPYEKTVKQMFDFIKETGLKIEECAPDKTIDDFRSWKIALYFENKIINCGNQNIYRRDFHYQLEEGPQLWSSKLGFTPSVEYINTKEPPQVFQSSISEFEPTVYNLYGTYQLTNPYADENNRYLKHLNINTSCGLKKAPKPDITLLKS